jgi:glucokinase
MTPPIIGIDIGGTKCAVSRLRPDGTIEEVGRFSTGAPDETVPRLLAAAADLQPGPHTAFGISCGSPQDSARGLILGPPNLPGWNHVPITDLFSERFGGPAYLMNDANACALAEWQYGAGRGCHSMIFLTAGTGMGAGLILNGRIYEGANGNAGEVGHLRLAPDGPVGYGKAGSFEGFCSGGGIARLARLHAWPNDDVTARELAEAAQRGNAEALALWQEVGTRLGEALAVIIDVLNPERIIIGSIYVRSRALLEPAMRAALAREALPSSLAACEIRPAELGETLGNAAAIAIAAYHLGTANATIAGTAT